MKETNGDAKRSSADHTHTSRDSVDKHDHPSARCESQISKIITVVSDDRSFDQAMFNSMLAREAFSFACCVQIKSFICSYF